MANYNYECNLCKKEAYSKFKDLLITDDNGDKRLPDELYEEYVLFETSHPINPTENELREATECPRCGKCDCTKTVYGAEVYGYTRGYGWLDRTGIRRDMNRYKLANDDPYAQYRTDGEVDHIDERLKKEGQFDPKRKHFLTGNNKDLEKSVEKAVTTKSE